MKQEVNKIGTVIMTGMAICVKRHVELVIDIIAVIQIVPIQSLIMEVVKKQEIQGILNKIRIVKITQMKIVLLVLQDGMLVVTLGTWEDVKEAVVYVLVLKIRFVRISNLIISAIKI